MSEEYESEADFARPFMTAFGGAPKHAALDLEQAETAQDEEADGHSDDMVRPYFVTGGRVHDAGGGLETVFSRTDSGTRNMGRNSFERHSVLRLCESPQSVAEISALLKMPLGVAAVVARDLESEGMLAKSTTMPDATSDPAIIMRLIDVVSAL